LPQIIEQQKDSLTEQIFLEEIFSSVMAAHEYSASGLYGQSIPMYKLLFKENSVLFTAAINQLVFVPGIATQDQFKWIKERKVVYIPTKSTLELPSDYRPLSMLEVLYKIPSQILAKRLISILDRIIGPYQHGFMQGKGIQEPH